MINKNFGPIGLQKCICKTNCKKLNYGEGGGESEGDKDFQLQHYQSTVLFIQQHPPIHADLTGASQIREVNVPGLNSFLCFLIYLQVCNVSVLMDGGCLFSPHL